VPIDYSPIDLQVKIANLPRLEMPEVVKRYHAIAPLCAVCTADMSARYNAPHVVPVERAIIVRDANYYFAIAHCHGDSTIVNISAAADGMPTDAKVKQTLAFTEKKRGRATEGAQTSGIRGDAKGQGQRDR
jgi:hypothetical protein